MVCGRADTARRGSVVGRLVILDGMRTEIIGVMPAEFGFPDSRVDAWRVEQVRPSDGFGLWDYDGVARLRDGVTLDDARAELQGLIPAVPTAYPDDPRAASNVQTRLLFTGRFLKESIRRQRRARAVDPVGVGPAS